jgi:hypothetical protein
MQIGYTRKEQENMKEEKECPWNQKMGMKNTERKLQRAGEASSSREEALWHRH